MRGDFLDACALFPITLRDTLLSIATQEAFHPLWSSEVLGEVRRTVVAKRGVDSWSLDRTLACIERYFEDSMVEGWQLLVSGLALPDPDDRHVLAAAIVGDAQSIVTFNLGDFPIECLLPYRVDAVHPDAFLLGLLHSTPDAVIAALLDQAGRKQHPPMDLDELLARLERCGVPRFCREVRRILVL
jgi:predicted nucleic acid-binding protein